MPIEIFVKYADAFCSGVFVYVHPTVWKTMLHKDVFVADIQIVAQD